MRSPTYDDGRRARIPGKIAALEITVGTFHAGELEMQRRAGVRATAARVGRIIQDSIPEGAAEFLERQPLLFLGHRDAAGRVRATLVAGPPGFIRVVDPRRVDIDGPALPPGDAGLLALDFDARERLRLNGRLEPRPGGVTFHATEVYSNCPKFIQRRSIEDERAERPGRGQTSSSLTPAQRDLISESDTFFIATVPPGLTADVSHRGGNPGFVRIVDPTHLAWDDYTGNAMFNTLGNLLRDPEAGLLFVDFRDGRLLQLNGRVQVTGDKVRKIGFEIAEVVEIAGGQPYRWTPPVYSPFNPR
jgi:predicted pyridoxine 5'-phosphate oxidase superfamily flavin-nucleotide-binding protein